MSINHLEGLAQALFAESGDALFLFDPDNEQLVAVSSMAEKLTQISQEELLKKPVMHWFHFPPEPSTPVRPASVSQRGNLRQAAARTGIFHSQEGYFLRTRDEGTLVPVNLTISRLHVQPKTLVLITARDVREQRDAYKKLKRVEAELRRVLTSVSDCLWSARVDQNRQWTYHFLSPVVQQITGKPPEFFQAGLKAWQSLVHAEDQPRWNRFVKQLLKGQSAEVEYRLATGDGTLRWVRESVQATPSRKGQGVRLDGVLADITNRKALEQSQQLLIEVQQRDARDLEAKNQALSDSERRYRQLTEATLDAIVVADGQGSILMFNPAAERLFGYTAAEIARQPLEQLLLAPSQALLQQGLADYQRTGRSQLVGNTVELLGRRKDGAEFPLELALSAFQSGGAAQFLAAIRDLTERNRLRTVLAQSEKLASIGRLSAGLAHEINNPVTFVGNNLEVLERDCLHVVGILDMYRAEHQRLAQVSPDAAARIEAAAEEIDLAYTRANIEQLLKRTKDGLVRVTRIVQGLRGYARTAPAPRQDVYLPDLVDSSLEIIQAQLRERNIQVERDYQDPPRIPCIYSDINQVLLNLLVNACHALAAMPKTHTGRIRISIRPADDYLVFEVADNGCGISPENKARLFDPFFTTKDVNQGTGLGLWISHNVITAHGGRIEVDSEPGAGARMRVLLPRQPPSALREQGSPARSAP